MNAVSEADESMWAAVAELAQCWAAHDVVRSFRDRLPRNQSGRLDGLPQLLQEMSAMGGSTWMEGRPFRVASHLPMMFSVGPIVQRARSIPAEDLNSWVSLAARVEKAHFEQVAWLRSRLPGYPLFRVPQLAVGTPWTTREFTYRTPWLREHMAAGLQWRDSPSVTPLLADPPADHGLDDAIRQFARAVIAHPVILKFADELAGLDADAVTQLRAARLDLRAALSSEQVDAHEPALALARNAYREGVVADRLARLSGNARTFAEAFDAVDDLLEVTLETVQQLAVFGEPAAAAIRSTVSLSEDGSVEGSGATIWRPTFWANAMITADMSLEGYAFPSVGMLLRIEDPLLRDVIKLEKFTLDFDAANGERLNITGRVLDGTAAAWVDRDFDA